MTEVGKGRLYLVTPAEYATLYDGGAKDGSVTSNGVTYVWDDTAVYAQIPQFGVGLQCDENYLTGLMVATEYALGGVMAGTTWIGSASLPVQVNEAGAMFVDALSTAGANAAFVSAVAAYAGATKTLSLAVTKNGTTSNITIPYATNAMYGTDASGVSDERAVSYEYLHKPAGTDTTTETYAAYVPEQSADITTYSITTTVSSSSTDSQLPTAKSVWTLSQNIGNLTLVTYDGSPTVSSLFPYFVVADSATGAQQLKTVSFATMKTLPYFIPWGTVYGTGGNNLAAGNGSVVGTSGQNYSGSTAVGVTAQATNSNATAIGASSTASNFEAVAIGIISQATAPYSSAIGSGSVVTNDQSIALGANSLCKVNSWLSIDTTSVNRAYTAYSTDYVFFRNVAVSSSITTQAGYTAGYTLTQALEGAALLLNGTAELTTRDEKTTLTNLITNGNFANGTTGWSANYGTISASNNKLTFVQTTSSVFGTVAVPLSSAIVSNHKYYGKISADILSGSNVTEFVFSIGNTYLTTLVSTGNHYDISGIVTASTTGVPGMFLRSSVAVSDKSYDISSAVLIDLTAAFGAGLEPTKAEMDAILLKLFPDTNGWFDGSDTRLIDSQWLLTGAHTWTAAQNLGTGTTISGATIVTSSTISYDSSTQTLTLF